MHKFEHIRKGTFERILTPLTLDVTDYETESNDNVVKVEALWDTGATVSVISEKVVKRLGLVPQDVTWIRSYDGTPVLRNVYRVDIVMSDDIRIEFVTAIEAPLPSSEILLGMNVIGLGDLHVLHPDYKTTILRFEYN